MIRAPGLSGWSAFPRDLVACFCFWIRHWRSRHSRAPGTRWVSGFCHRLAPPAKERAGRLQGLLSIRKPQELPWDSPLRSSSPRAAGWEQSDTARDSRVGAGQLLQPCGGPLPRVWPSIQFYLNCHYFSIRHAPPHSSRAASSLHCYPLPSRASPSLPGLWLPAFPPRTHLLHGPNVTLLPTQCQLQSACPISLIFRN